MNKTPESSGATVIYQEFGLSARSPLRGGVELDEFARTLELDAGMSERLAAARRNLVSELGDGAAYLRSLRLAAGLSQAGLGSKAGATQSYIARIEAGSVDPGTDMIARLADALGVPSDAVFVAVRRQRDSLNG